MNLFMLDLESQNMKTNFIFENQFFIMHESTLDLFCNDFNDDSNDEYAMELEKKAAELEITLDYYLMEFV